VGRHLDEDDGHDFEKGRDLYRLKGPGFLILVMVLAAVAAPVLLLLDRWANALFRLIGLGN
jgi:hypothetical protein